MLCFDLYFDESGNFEEQTLLEDGTIERRERPQPGASQLVGILAPSDCITASKSEQILSTAHLEASLVLGHQCHATDLLKHGQQEKYSLLLTEFLSQVEFSNFQPVRLCNSARLGFGNKVTTYTSMVAEMVVRIFEELTREHGGVQIGLNITAARVRLNGHVKNAPQIFIDEIEYKKRLDEQIAFAAVRRGVAHNKLNWSITGFRFGSGLKDRPLQVCDLLSNASYRNFRNCTAEQKRQLKALFGEYDFTFNRTEVLDEIESHRRDGSFAQAVQTIAENWNRPELDHTVRQKIKEHASSIVRHLTGLPSPSRNIYLRQLADWGSQFIAIRDLDLADTMLRWLEKNIAESLCKEVIDPIREDVHWFLAQLLILRLGQHNHRGELLLARPICNRLQNLFPLLAGQWEHASLITEAMTLRAVHLNDCCEYDEASRTMEAVDGFYGGLSSLMVDALPGVFPERVRAKHRGIALGTWMQSEMFAGLSDPSRLDCARRLNEMAIDEFTAESDQLRQYQYRCQIETYAGNLSLARTWLAKSLKCDSDSHSALAATIKSMDGFIQGFALLHWTRIGMEAGRRDLMDELRQFLDALADTKLNFSPWITQQDQEYPAHGICRHLAIALAKAGRYKDSREVFDRLYRLETKSKGVLSLIRLAGLLETIALWPFEQQDTIRNLLYESGKYTSLLQQQLSNLGKNSYLFPSVHELVQQLEDGVDGYEVSNFRVTSKLILACSVVGT